MIPGAYDGGAACVAATSAPGAKNCGKPLLLEEKSRFIGLRPAGASDMMRQQFQGVSGPRPDSEYANPRSLRRSPEIPAPRPRVSTVRRPIEPLTRPRAAALEDRFALDRTSPERRGRERSDPIPEPEQHPDPLCRAPRGSMAAAPRPRPHPTKHAGSSGDRSHWRMKIARERAMRGRRESRRSSVNSAR